jgi:hypothetical protein
MPPGIPLADNSCYRRLLRRTRRSPQTQRPSFNYVAAVLTKLLRNTSSYPHNNTAAPCLFMARNTTANATHIERRSGATCLSVGYTSWAAGRRRGEAETAQHESRPILRTWLRTRRPKLRLTTEPGPKLRIYRRGYGHVGAREGPPALGPRPRPLIRASHYAPGHSAGGRRGVNFRFGPHMGAAVLP